MDKQAFLDGLMEAVNAKFSDPKFTHEKAIPALDRIFSHNTLSSILGGAGGTAAGLAGTALQSPDKSGKKHWLRNAALGGLTGAGVGYGASKLVPTVSQELTRTLVQRPIGRVMTNTYEPRAYVNNLGVKKLKDYPGLVKDDQVQLGPVIKETLKAGLTDKPAPWLRDDVPYENRMMLYRKSFGLPERDVDQYSRRFIKEIPGKPNDWTVNTDTPEGKKYFSQLFPEGDRTRLLKQLQNHDTGSELGYDLELLGAYNTFAKKGPGGAVNVSMNDPWDFDIKPNEALNKPVNWARYFLNNTITPQTVRVNAPFEKVFPEPVAPPPPPSVTDLQAPSMNFQTSMFSPRG